MKKSLIYLYLMIALLVTCECKLLDFILNPKSDADSHEITKENLWVPSGIRVFEADSIDFTQVIAFTSYFIDGEYELNFRKIIIPVKSSRDIQKVDACFTEAIQYGLFFDVLVVRGNLIFHSFENGIIISFDKKRNMYCVQKNVLFQFPQ